MIFTPALARPFVAANGNYVDYNLQLVHGTKSVSIVEREIINVLPKGTTYTFHVTSDVVTQVNRSIEPVGIALSVFSLIAALSALVITAGLLARALSSDDGDFEVLRALGAGPRTVALSGVLGVMSAVVAGSILALVVGVALSPIGPIGPVRPVYPHAGFGFDWTALGAGLAFFVLTLGGAATILGPAPFASLRSREAILWSPRRFEVGQRPREGRTRVDRSHGRALRARTRERPRRRADSLNARRRDFRGNDRRRHTDLRQRTFHVDFAPVALRLELEPRVNRKSRRATSIDRSFEPRSTGEVLVGRQLRERAD